jgi:prepilin peptidase CpaA
MHHAIAITLAALLAIAVASDLRSRRIPNKLVLIGIVVAMVFHTVALGTGAVPFAGSAWWSPLAGMTAGLALMMPLRMLRAMGMGDVKLMVMVGAFVGGAAVVSATLYTLVAGGLLSVTCLLGRGVAVHTVHNLRVMFAARPVHADAGGADRLSPLQRTAFRLPYALAIAVGTGASWLWPLTMMKGYAS